MRNILLGILAIISASLPAQELTLKSCIDTCLQKNFSLRISRNEQQIAKNNVTLANAGYLPTLDLKAGYNADLTSSSGKLRSTGNTESSYNSLDHSLNAGINLEWTIFDGFNISTTYKQLKEFEQIGEANTRLILEEFVADLIAEYYNFVQQRCRLENYYHAVLFGL